MARASSDQVNNLTLMNRDKLLADKVLSPTGRRNHKTHGLSICETSSVEATRIRRKSEPVKSACVQCQKRKTKCSGHRPSCRSCSDRGIGCSWNIEEGLTRTAGLKKQLREAVGRSEDLCVLVDAMRRGTDEVSSMLLAKLRIGMALDDLLTGICALVLISGMLQLFYFERQREDAMCRVLSLGRSISAVFCTIQRMKAISLWQLPTGSGFRCRGQAVYE
jgi:hypothetical protein